MKRIIVFILFLALASCKKEPQDCTQTVKCHTVTWGFSKCHTDENGKPIFFNIRPDTSYSLVSVCKTNEYIQDGKDAEKRLYEVSDSVWRAFLDEYPIKCDCED